MEKKYLSTLVFDNYMVTELSYKHNPNFSFDTNHLDVGFELSAKVQLTNENDSAVTLKAVCGSSDNSECPFTIVAEVLGIFKYEGEIEVFKELATTNAIAILFPYVRSLVSDLSSRSNIYPQFKLPLLNVVEFIKGNDNLEIIMPD
jgi:preprotein translocase subunit secB